ncbi:hypothetical protein WAX74_09120 [Psychrobacillus sp. FJAT-51614]|uniref:Uncharacterized protein n=1 Tax=Psychrobacillus mangrovi TaxID=3117745 RepID=A0ABU8F454_9BACI
MELASYVKQLNQPIKIYLSVPSNLLFSYFFVFGAVDYDFKNPSKESLLDQYLNLKNGQRILYKTGDEWIAHSVIEVSQLPNSDTRAIVVKNRLNSINYIPETRWFSNVRIHDDEITTVRNTRRVNNVYNIIDNKKLKKFYPEENLHLLMMQNTPQTYVYTNKKEWNNFLDVIQLNIDGESLQLSDLLFDGSEGTFRNLSFIEQNHSATIPKEAIVIFVGSSRALRKMDHFEKQKCMFIIDQHDSNEKFEDLQFKIEQDFLMNQSKSVNKELLDYMDEKHVEIPKGVEIFAWL